jgi:hypothetical protein
MEKREGGTFVLLLSLFYFLSDSLVALSQRTFMGYSFS